jgi:signal transduction histidine kinase
VAQQFNGFSQLQEVSASLEYKLLRMTSLASMLTAGAAIVYDGLVTRSIPALGIEVVSVGIFAVFFWAAKDPRRSTTLKFYFLGVLWLMMNLAFRYTGGLGDSFVALLLLAATVTIILVPAKQWPFAVGFMVADIVAMIVAENLFPEIRRILGPDQRDRVLVTSHIFLAISFVILMLMVGYLKLRYDELRNIAIEQNARLMDTNRRLSIVNDDLHKKNDAIAVLNANLETSVAHRTAEISAYQQRLLDLAFFHSHRMRGPLANILGLIDVLPERNGEDETNRLIGLMKQEAKKLDTNLHEVTDELQRSRDKSD